MKNFAIKKSVIWLLSLLCVLFWLPAPLSAGTSAKLHFIGFSADGKYLAFEQYGTGDATGEPFAMIYFVDTQKNAFVGKSFEVWDLNGEATETEARRRAAARAARELKRLKIVPGNTGKLLVAHLPTDRSYTELIADREAQYVDGVMTDKIRFVDEENLFEVGEYYELTLKSVIDKNAACESIEPALDFHRLELSLDLFVGGETVWPRSLILQKDETLPKSRGCPLSYTPERVYAYKDKLAVFIGILKPGFEGPDSDYMVVTGKYTQE